MTNTNPANKLIFITIPAAFRGSTEHHAVKSIQDLEEFLERQGEIAVNNGRDKLSETEITHSPGLLLQGFRCLDEQAKEVTYSKLIEFCSVQEDDEFSKSDNQRYINKTIALAVIKGQLDYYLYKTLRQS